MEKETESRRVDTFTKANVLVVARDGLRQQLANASTEYDHADEQYGAAVVRMEKWGARLGQLHEQMQATQAAIDAIDALIDSDAPAPTTSTDDTVIHASDPLDMTLNPNMNEYPMTAPVEVQNDGDDSYV